MKDEKDVTKSWQMWQENSRKAKTTTHVHHRSQDKAAYQLHQSFDLVPLHPYINGLLACLLSVWNIHPLVHGVLGDNTSSRFVLNLPHPNTFLAFSIVNTLVAFRIILRDISICRLPCSCKHCVRFVQDHNALPQVPSLQSRTFSFYPSRLAQLPWWPESGPNEKQTAKNKLRCNMTKLRLSDVKKKLDLAPSVCCFGESSGSLLVLISKKSIDLQPLLLQELSLLHLGHCMWMPGAIWCHSMGSITHHIYRARITGGEKGNYQQFHKISCTAGDYACFDHFLPTA